MNSGPFIMTVWDYLIIGVYFAFCIWVGLRYKDRGSEHGLESYVVAGRSLPWWLIGTSMVATTFSAETPLLVAGFVYGAGISKNWEWWCFLPGAMLTTFLFARLWRRTEVLTDAQFVQLRYSGGEAHVLRAFRALYMGFIMNTIVLGSALVVSGKIGTTLIGVDESHPNFQLWRIGIAAVCAVVAVFYSSLAGLAGIVVTDFVQFSLAMTGAIIIAAFACMHPEVGGLSGLVQQISTLHPGHLDFIPRAGLAGAGKLTLLVVGLFLTVRWWAQVYGGAEPGGASHVAQRMLSARTEKDAIYGTLWFNIAHYAVRPWPWILTGLAAMLIFPGAKDGEQAYIWSINLVPAGLKGLVLAGFFSALMSIDTRLNLGAAYFVNDFYKPYIVPLLFGSNGPEAPIERGREDISHSPLVSDAHLVRVSRIATVVQLLCAFLMLLVVTRVQTIAFMTFAIGSGAGLVYLLRWYWWRVNAWSEIGAMTAGLVNLVVFRWFVFPSEEQFNASGVQILLWSLAIVTPSWIIVTLLTRPTDPERLKAFYRQVRVAGPGWAAVARDVRAEDGVLPATGYSIPHSLLAWLSATALVYSVLFGTGKLLLGQPVVGMVLLAIAIAFLVILGWAMRAREGAAASAGAVAMATAP
jgi:Na+/proline symporter